MSLVIRRAAEQDVETILAMTRLLATYEGSLSDVISTRTGFLQSLFRENPWAFCEIAEWNGHPAGFALWYHSFSIFLGRNGLWLEDLFVDKPFRRRGIGRAMFTHLAKHCVREDLGRLEWSVLRDNQMAINFYKQMTAVLDDGRMKCRLTAASIQHLASGQSG